MKPGNGAGIAPRCSDRAIEAIQFGEADEAAGKLKTFIEGSLAEADRRRALAAESPLPARPLRRLAHAFKALKAAAGNQF